MRIIVDSNISFPAKKIRRMLKLSIKKIGFECKLFHLVMNKSRCRVHGFTWQGLVCCEKESLEPHYHVELLVPVQDLKDLENNDKKRLVRIIEHEINHLMGLEHADMIKLEKIEIPYFNKILKIIEEV